METSNGAKRQLGILFGVLVLLFVTVVTLFVVAFKQQQNQNTEQKRQLNFLCANTRVVGFVLQDAVDQAEANFQNGTYQRLLDKGFITQKDLNQTRRTIKFYKDQIAILHDVHSPCAGRS